MDWTLNVPATVPPLFVNEIDRIEAEVRTQVSGPVEPGEKDPRVDAAQIQNAVRAVKQIAPHLRDNGERPAAIAAEIEGKEGEIRITVLIASQPDPPSRTR